MDATERLLKESLDITAPWFDITTTFFSAPVDQAHQDGQVDSTDFGSLLDNSYGIDAFADPYNTFLIDSVPYNSGSQLYGTNQSLGSGSITKNISDNVEVSLDLTNPYRLGSNDTALTSDVNGNVAQGSASYSSFGNIGTGECSS